jgi:hypothetical protein
MSATDELARIIKSAEAAMARGDLDRAEALVNSVMRKQAADDEDEGMEDTWSEHADAESDGNNASLDDDEEESDFEDDENDDEDDPAVIKAEAFVANHRNMSDTVSRGHHPETYRTGISPTVSQPQRHKFDARVEYIADRDSCSKTEAMSRARQEYPETYSNYQQHLARQRTSAQHVVRGGHFIGKRTPTTYEDLVSAEIRKGCSHEIAGQRVAQQHGFAAMRTRSTFAKAADTISDRFNKRVDQIAFEDGCGLDEATRRARIENPRLYAALRSI